MDFGWQRGFLLNGEDSPEKEKGDLFSGVHVC